MKKDELLNELYKLKRFEVSVGVLDFMSKTAVKFNHVLALVEQLDEPEKVVIPQFVADYIQEGKELGCDLGTAMTVQTEMLKDIRDYIKNNEELFARAWLDGYEVEKEKLYYIPLGVKRAGQLPLYLFKSAKGIDIDWSPSRYIESEENAHLYRFTESEIKSIIPNYWPFAEPVEEEEE